jgi:hypothetical protein
MRMNFEEDLVLGAETMVAVADDGILDDQPDADEAVAQTNAHRAAWARHVLRSNGFGGAMASNDVFDEDDLQMRDVIRQVLALRWD